MGKNLIVGTGAIDNPIRKIDLGPLRFLIEKHRTDDMDFVVYKLSYSSKFIYIKGRTLAGSLIILADTLNSVSDGNYERFKDHLYTHIYNHILDRPGGRFRVKVIAQAAGDFYSLLKQEQMALDADRYNPQCLNNQVEAYIPKYNEKTGDYGWIPKHAVLSFKKWLSSAERMDHAALYKK